MRYFKTHSGAVFEAWQFDGSLDSAMEILYKLDDPEGYRTISEDGLVHLYIGNQPVYAFDWVMKLPGCDFYNVLDDETFKNFFPEEVTE